MKIVLVNLNYRIDVHMNFAQSRNPELVCSLQSECGYHQARSQAGQRGNATTDSFRLIIYMYLVLLNLVHKLKCEINLFHSYVSYALNLVHKLKCEINLTLLST